MFSGQMNPAAGLPPEQSELWCQKIIETAQEGVAIADPSGQLTYVNNRMAEMIGYQPSELVGQPFTAFQASTDQERNRPSFPASSGNP